VRGIAPPAPPPLVLPRLRLPRALGDLRKPSRYKALHGGRGSGKSHIFAELLVRRCVEKAPVRAVCIREVQRSLDQSVKRLIEDKIQALGAGSAFTVQADRILGPEGGRIIFQGMQTHTAESIKSLEGYDIAWVEEAQSLSKRSLELLRPTIRKAGSELWFSWNPTRPDDPVDALFRAGPAPPRTTLLQANWTENRHFPKVLKAELEWDRDRDPDKYQHVWLGGYQRTSEARVFQNWRVEAFETPADARFLFGADWGFARDPTVLVRCFLVGRTLFVDHEAYRVGCEIDRTPALFDTVPAARDWPIIGDSARPETISYLQRYGFPRLRAAQKGAGSVKEGVEFLKSCDILVHPRCRHLVDELALYAWRTDPRTGEILPELEERENHVIDALRYALEGQRSAGTYDASLDWVGSPGWGWR
jgi:phage terminase large subunit